MNHRISRNDRARCRRGDGRGGVAGRGRRLLFSALLVALGAAVVSAVRGTPEGSVGAQGRAGGMAWYLDQGQFQADLKTLGAMTRYLLTWETPMPELAESTNLPMPDVVGLGLPGSNAVPADVRSPG